MKVLVDTDVWSEALRKKKDRDEAERKRKLAEEKKRAEEEKRRLDLQKQREEEELRRRLEQERLERERVEALEQAMIAAKKEALRRPWACNLPLAHVHRRCRRLAKTNPLYREENILNAFLQ